jgi:hypothetical protein
VTSGKITIHRLLGMTSNIPNYTDDDLFNNEEKDKSVLAEGDIDVD